MKAQEKPLYVQEARGLLDSIDINTLVENPNSLQEINKINRLIGIFTNFSYNDGQDLKNLLHEFQRSGRRSTHKGTIRNRIIDMIQFIGQKIAELRTKLKQAKQENNQTTSQEIFQQIFLLMKEYK